MQDLACCKLHICKFATCILQEEVLPVYWPTFWVCAPLLGTALHGCSLLFAAVFDRSLPLVC